MWGNHIQRVNIVINENIIEQVTDFKYLGYRISWYKSYLEDKLQTLQEHDDDDLYIFRAGLQLIIRRYYSVYTAIVMSCVYVDWLLAAANCQPT